jgi:hypothetical protein
MAELFVSFEEFNARRPEPFPDETRGRVEAHLSDASGLIREVAGPLYEWPDPVPETIRQMVMRLAARAIDNPNGIVSESIGDASYRLSRNAQAGMALSPEERQEVEFALGIPPLYSVEIGVGYEPQKMRQFTPIGWTDHTGTVDWWQW